MFKEDGYLALEIKRHTFRLIHELKGYCGYEKIGIMLCIRSGAKKCKFPQFLSLQFITALPQLKYTNLASSFV